MFVNVLSGFGSEREGMSFARRIRVGLCSPNIHLPNMFLQTFHCAALSKLKRIDENRLTRSPARSSSPMRGET